MEEINIFLDNKISIYYLSLFDNIIKDENHYKIGRYDLNDEKLNIDYDHGEKDQFKFIKNVDNIKYFGEIKNLGIKNDNIKICHKYWEDELSLKNNICYRFSNHDQGKYILKQNEIIIKWDDYNEEKFILNENDNKYHFFDEGNNNKKKILIKNFSWENEIILDKKEKKCIRLNETKDKGTFNIEGNYLYINWIDWDKEVFYLIDDIYYNNKKFINKKKLIFNDCSNIFECDKEYIYIENKKYKYEYQNKELIVNDYDYRKFIYLDDEYYYIDYFEKYNLDNKIYFVYKNDNVILNNLNTIIGSYKKIKNNILNIKWYNDDINFYNIKSNNLILINIILLKNDKIEKYYIVDKLLYDETFDNIINFDYVNNNEIILENNLRYEKNNDVFELIEDSNKKEIILLSEKLITYFYDNNTLYNSNTRYMCLTDDNFNDIYIKIKGKIYIYCKLYDNIYINKYDFDSIKSFYFNEIIFKYFENELNDTLLTNIKNKNIISSFNTFNNQFLFLENINFNYYYDKNYDIFQNYGYFNIIEMNFNKINNQDLYIINFDKNEDFMNNQDIWFEYLEKNKENLILIFDDYSHYDFINEIFDFSENYINYSILINYSKSSEMLHFYLNKLIKNLKISNKISKVNFITNINDKIKNYRKLNNIDINKTNLHFIYNIIDLIIFCIYFYIKNKNTFVLPNNFSISMNLYEKITF